jgi:lipopolysaccharide biosynthesis glycosyltransferase
METINIIFSSDDNYAQFMGVALCSIFENKKAEYKIDVYVLDGGISNENMRRLKILEGRYNFRIIYLKVNLNIFKDFYVSKYITQATYFRILIPSLLPDINKVLYLDCDVIIMGDIFELYSVDIENYFFAAVADYFSENTRNIELNMPLGSTYFNAGVMLMNLGEWRDRNISFDIINFIKKNPEKLKLFDQDALNAIMWDKYLNISLKYNYVTSLLNKDYLGLRKEISEILIIHYAGGKPWHYFDRNPLNKYYFKYLKKTPWKGKNYTDLNIKSIIGNIYYILKDFLFK